MLTLLLPQLGANPAAALLLTLLLPQLDAAVSCGCFGAGVFDEQVRGGNGRG